MNTYFVTLHELEEVIITHCSQVLLSNFGLIDLIDELTQLLDRLLLLEHFLDFATQS